MNFVPLGDRVAVEVSNQEEKTAGGIIIPDSAKEKPAEGKVLAVGPGIHDQNGNKIAMQLKVGDKIMFGKWAGTEIKINGKQILIMKESDVMGVING